MRKIFLILFFCLIIIFTIFLTSHLSFQEETISFLDEIRKRGKIVVGTTPLFPPFEYYDEKGNLVGFDIDLSKEIANQLGLELEVKALPWEKLFHSLILTGEIDMIISALSFTPERAKFIGFSIPYFNSGQVFLVREEMSVESLEEMKNKKIGVQADTISEMEGAQFTTRENLFSFKNYQLAVEALLKEEIDAVLLDYPLAKFIKKENKKLKTLPYIISHNFYSIGLRKGDEKFVLEINKIIQKLKKSGHLKFFEEKWLKN